MWVLFPIAALLVVSLPVLLPFVAIAGARDRRIRRKAADATDCAVCGTRLGAAALDAADTSWAATFAGCIRPEAVARVVRRLWAIGTACGARYDFDPAPRTFIALTASTVPSGGAAAPCNENPRKAV